MAKRFMAFVCGLKTHKYFVTDGYSLVSVKTLTASSAEKMRLSGLEVVTL